jgi:hypothetical protein
MQESDADIISRVHSMNIASGAYPPNYQQINDAFSPPFNAVFTYGDTIYNPGAGDIPKHLELHERTHMRQQGDDPQAWWDEFIANPQFRLKQEIEAYRAQYQSLRQTVKDRKQQFRWLHVMCTALSDKMYGNIVDYGQAMKLITGKGKA